MRNPRRTKVAALVLGVSLIAAACSDDDDGTSTATTTRPTESSVATSDTASDDTVTDDTATDDTATDDTTDATTDETTPGATPSGEVGAVGGSGCGTPHGPYEDPGEPTGEVRVAWNDPLLSFNNNSTRSGAVANSNPLYITSAGGFSYYDGELNYVNNDQFGTCTIESLDPLTVTYRINDGVTWSDGTQVDAADMILYWGAVSTVFNSGEGVIAPDGTTAEADAEGLPVVLDPSGNEIPDAEVPYDPDGDGSLPEGYTYKPSTDVVFDAVSPSLSLVTEFPEISEDGLAATITWDTFYVDYQIGGLVPDLPAHVVARNALGIEDPAEAKRAIIDAFQNNDAAALKPISDFWNSGFDATSLPEDAGIYRELRAVPAHRLRRAEPDDVRGQPRLHVGSEAEDRHRRVPHHR